MYLGQADLKPSFRGLSTRQRLARRWRRLRIGPWLRRQQAMRTRQLLNPPAPIPKYKPVPIARKIAPIVETWRRPL